uniref:Endonuclease/exonuclease/phosphatase domain-containing protein n=2 Tax=Phaeomonas parva TaxID=124430 RepID=A0A7S1XLL6_9STRA|mmetsp:Transcript_17885/g.54747  ORF Transcript_17885/g.54747 Transcript_17885/m.54747 type:complete len:530 (+) Transcript_17885:257-1846(+)
MNRMGSSVEVTEPSMMGEVSRVESDLHVATWNIAAINNNPFEYWLTYDNDYYKTLMQRVQDYIENPDESITVETVFTDDMYSSLRAEMLAAGWPEQDIAVVDGIWNSDFKQRQAVNGFLKDKELGLKRLASMPDRVTNTVSTESGMDYRPTVINCYGERLASVADWWAKWQSYMFATGVVKSSVVGQAYAQVLKPIKKSKYPAITEQEEAVSLPLQTLSLAIFDGILVDMLARVQGADGDWQDLRSNICANLNHRKTDRILEILSSQYAGADAVLLQEVARSFITRTAEGPLGQGHHVLYPATLDPKRDQNSVILLRKSRFDVPAGAEVTDRVFAQFPANAAAPAAAGDIFATLAEDKVSGDTVMVASFHGDTNGLASVPVMKAVNGAYRELKREHAGLRLIFGLDANTYRAKKEGYQNVLEFAEAFTAVGLTSIFGDVPNPDYVTTYNARTYLQPQLNKATKSDETAAKGDVNPKDFILFGADDFTPVTYGKDNTGGGTYVENMVFPTLKFPSDHGVLSALLRYSSQV